MNKRKQTRKSKQARFIQQVLCVCGGRIVLMLNTEGVYGLGCDRCYELWTVVTSSSSSALMPMEKCADWEDVLKERQLQVPSTASMQAAGQRICYILA